MVKVVVDSSVLIDFSRTGKGVFLGLSREFKQGRIEVLIPTVVIYEFWSGKSMESMGKQKRAETMFGQFRRLVLTESIAKVAGGLSRNLHLEGMDAVIAATCLREKAKLATLNEKDFSRVKGLEIWRSS